MPPSTSPVVVHAIAFCVLFLAGVVVAAGFDLSRAVRRAFTLSPLAAHALDALTVAVLLPLAAAGLLLADWGQMRGYTFLGVGGGAGAYQLLASPPLLRAEVWVLRSVAWLWGRSVGGLRRLGRWGRGAARRIGSPAVRGVRWLRSRLREALRRHRPGAPPPGPAGS